MKTKQKTSVILLIKCQYFLGGLPVVDCCLNSMNILQTKNDLLLWLIDSLDFVNRVLQKYRSKCKCIGDYLMDKIHCCQINVMQVCNILQYCMLTNIARCQENLDN